MPESNGGRSIEVTGRSESADAVEAVRDALSEVLKGLIAAGYGPHHLTTMRDVPDHAVAAALQRTRQCGQCGD
jgi:hypothetical protein